MKARGGIFCGLLLSVLPSISNPSESTPPRSDHWAFRPTKSPIPPQIAAAQSARTPIDNFIIAQLEHRLAPGADKPTLIRRATYDLIGLPPTPEEVAAFVADRSSDAFDKLIERLLASPHYGEHWGRHWMDVVRYADTAGDNADYPVPELHLYRGYIIDAFNSDKPFDRFVQEQLAGDILARDTPGEYAQSIIATGFLALSRRYGTGPYELWHLTLENTIDTVGQAFLGLNLKCARCHDHKFDPLTMRDYYGLYGIFASTDFPWAGAEELHSKNLNRQKFVPLVPEADASPKLQAWETRLKALRDETESSQKETIPDKSRAEERDRRVAELKKQLRNLERLGAPADLPVAYAVWEGKPADVALQRRGEPDQSGPIVPRCAPEALTRSDPLRIPPGASGRLQFSRWVTSRDNPLTARVMVNRIWQHHFGEGLVKTPNNFGRRSEEPAHRELLDYLATRFVENGWSVKAMHRLIMASAVYQQSSVGYEENTKAVSSKVVSSDTVDQAVSGDTEWGSRGLLITRSLLTDYSRFRRRRLSAEEIRDAMLFVSGELDLRRPAPHPFPPPEKWTWTQHAPFKERYESKHRSVYLMTQRLQKHPFLALFDGPDTNSSTESRRDSTVPQQSLFAMNNPFVEEQARALARRVMRATTPTSERIRHIHELAWGRPPTMAELKTCQQWLTEAAALARDAGIANERRDEEAWTLLARVMLTSNEFFYVD